MSYTDTVIPVSAHYTVAVNGTRGNALVIKNADGKNYKVVDCMGNETDNGRFVSDIAEITVPTAGMVFIQ